tara:strand:- start:14953 stop:16611 length:1659 start_codon:yes stop_codon:yes gene_type:complete
MSTTKSNSYNGNSSLKQIGWVHQYAQEEVRELLKCTQDPIYFIETYCQIVSLDAGLVPFKLYDCQKEKVDTIMNNRKVIIMEGRQQGKTVTSAACILHYTLFQSNKTVAILANKSASAREVLYRYQIMYENLPLWMQQGVKTWNKGDVELENGSKIFTSATSISGIRGKSVNWLYIDEAAIVPNNVAEEFFTSTYPTIMAGETTKVLLTSTPLGYNHFWKFWNDAEEDRNGFTSLHIPYHRVPGRDEKWAEEQKKVLGELKFNQEVLCTFLGSSNTLINADTIRQLSAKTFSFTKNGLDIIEDPVKDNFYFISVDVSRGVGGDYSAFTVMDCTKHPFSIVAKYRDNNITPLLFPNIIYKVAKDYNNAHVLIEINDIGQQVADILYNEIEYENMLWVGNDSRYGQYLSSSGKSANLGVRTTKQIKRIGCATLKSLVEEKKLLVFDSDIISEFSTFVEQRGSFQADEGYHDDLVMTLVLFAWASNDLLFKDMMNTNNRKALYDQKMVQIEEELTPFGFIDNGNDEPDYEVNSGDLWLSDKYQKNLKDFLKEKIL